MELMISLTIGLILVAGISTLIAQQSSTRAEINKSARQIENGRYALTLLQDDIQNAGFYGQYSDTPPALTALPDPCALGLAALTASLAMPIQGYDAPSNPTPLSACLPDANHIAGTDILVVRRLQADGLSATVASAVTGTVYIQTTPNTANLNVGPDPTPSAPTNYISMQKDGVTPALLLKFVEHIYFLSPCNVYAAGATTCSASADGGNPVPTLKRLELTTMGGVPAWTTVPLVEGIQNMQFDYGIDTTNSGVPGTPFVTAPAVTDWPNVMVIGINLLARNTEPTGGYSDSVKSYTLGLAGTTGPFSDAYKRHVYNASVRIVNLSSRRE